MLFVTKLNVIPGHARDAIKLCKYPQVPPEVEIKHRMGLFGKPDIMIIFEAPDELLAAEFTMQFSTCADCETSLATNLDELKWTHM